MEVTRTAAPRYTLPTPTDLGLPGWLQDLIAAHGARAIVQEFADERKWSLDDFLEQHGVPEDFVPVLGVTDPAESQAALLPLYRRVFIEAPDEPETQPVEALALLTLLAWHDDEDDPFLPQAADRWGTPVGYQMWDGECPGMCGGGSVYRLGNVYVARTDDMPATVHSSLRDALTESGVRWVGGATSHIVIHGLSAGKAAALLMVDEGAETGHAFTLNGEPWYVTRHRRLRRQRRSEIAAPAGAIR